MRLSEIRGLSSDEAATLARTIRETTGSRGWQTLLRVLEEQADIHLSVMRQPPRGGERADSYALRQADMAGFVRGLQAINDTASRVLRDADAVVAQHQRAAEQAALLSEEA